MPALQANLECDRERPRVGLAFAHLNLRCNPFGELSARQRAALAVVDVESIVARLDDPRYAVQFIGERGHGKTTHLLAILDRMPHAGYVHVPEGETRPVPRGTPVIVDEAQRLKRLQRFRLFRRPVPLVLGTHEDFSRALRKAGREVRTIAVGDQMTVDRLRTLVNRRILYFRRGPGRVPQVTTAAAARLLERFGSNVRAVEGLLYDRLQTMREVDHVQV